MRCKIASILLAASGLIACSNKKELSRGEGFGFFKNPESNQACLNTNLSQWELSGEFLHRMLICASNRSTDGGETLPATQTLLANLSPEKMQALVDFALMPDETATTHEGRYPYLLALATIMDRGLTQGQKQGLNLASERLESLQPFLLSLEPGRVQKQMALWSQSGRLDELLGELGLFVQSLEQDTLSAITREVLEGRNFGPRFLTVSQAVLTQNPLMDSLDAALSAHALQIPDSGSQSRLINAWRQPQSPDAPDRNVTPGNFASAPTSFAQHLDGFSRTLSDAEVQKLSHVLISFWNSYRGLDPRERESISRRLTSSLEQGLDQQKNLAQWLMAVAQDLATMPASDLNGISETLRQLLEPSNDPTLDTLRSKLWSSRIMEKFLALISSGGPVPGCSAFTIRGMQELSDKEFAPTYELIRSLNIPQAGCDGRVPMKAALESWSNVAVSHACTSQDCLQLEEKTNHPSITASYWADAYAEPETPVMQDLVRSSLIEARTQLIRDRYALRNMGIATRAVAPEVIDHILALWDKAAPKQLKDLAAWEQGLESDTTLQNLFAADPIEKLISLKLERLSSLSQQFHDLLPEGSHELDKATNQRAARVFAGAYNQGPLEQALRYKLPATLEGAEDLLQDPDLNWPAELKQNFASNRSLFSHFLQRFKSADSIFRNPELASLADGSEILMSSLGHPLRYAGFTERGSVRIQPGLDSRVIQPKQAIHAVGDGDSTAWGLWHQQLDSSPLVSKDQPAEQTAAFETFSTAFAQAISSDARWKDLTAAEEPVWSREASAIPGQFFDVEPYSATDARLIALYYLRHYHKLPQAFPVQAQLPPPPTGALRGFFSGAAMVTNMDADYTLFAKLFPDQWNDTQSTLEALAAATLTSLNDNRIFTPQKIPQVNKVGNLNSNAKIKLLLTDSNFKALSTLNLLGLTKSGTQFYVQPLIGINGGTCLDADGKAAPCSLELNSAADYQTFVSAVVAQNFCPLLQGDQFGSKSLWEQRLQLKVAQSSTCDSSRVMAAAVSEEVRFPAWLSRRILGDIFTMGRHAQLKKGLAQIPAALRFYKIAQQNLSAKERSDTWLRQARGHWSALNAASQSRRQFYSIQFWAMQPNLLNAAIDQWEQSIDPLSWSDFLGRLAQRGEEGTSKDLVHEFFALVIETQAASARAGHSLLEMGFDLMERISARPDLLDAAGHVLGNFASAENYDFAGRDLVYAMTLFNGSFHWNDPGPRFSQFLAQRETIQTWVLLCEHFSPDELGRLLNQLQKSSAELGTTAERAALMTRFLQENVALGTLWDSAVQQTLSQRWNDILHAWQKADFGRGFSQQWEALLATLDMPLQTLDGRASYKTAEIMELWLPHLLRQGVSLLHSHQQAGAVTETSFWSKVALNLVQSVQSQTLGARAFSRFLADPRLGLVQSQLWIRALTASALRHKLSEALISLSSVAEHQWREALVESSDLLGRLSKALGYMKQRMVWKEDPDHNAYRQFIDQMYALSSDLELRDRQIEVLQLWFKDDE